ncbi:hypothetical protein BCR36DRAFT_413117 [Piromyces finnis]|uniref:SH3 domain-containing protein n=1 Tax=Piromyces finnis TaxID=1754191 RepID=A0A1Y1V8V3_9FUNG|nr:hypothetical protein BCR36DRAFT_413117 [Piromyces finnis]|eukprot:ORX48699.1 hypothetical protein BCR36DRAFT_413117 [Piromyces finnis]
MAIAKTLFIFTLILQTGFAGTVVAILSKDGAFLSMGILSALIFLSLLIALMIFWSKKLKYLYMYIITVVLWLIITVFLFLDIFGIFHILESLDNLIIGRSAINNYKNNTSAIPSLSFYLYIGLMVFMVLGAILACFVPLKQNIKQTDEYGNVYRDSKTVSIYSSSKKKTRFASEVITINNSDIDGGDPGITIIPNNNNYFNSLDYNKRNDNYNNYDMLPTTDKAPFLNTRQSMNNNVNYNSLRRMKNETPVNNRYDNDYYSRDNINPEDFDESIKYNTLSSSKPKSPMSPLKQFNESTNRSSTFDRSFASRRGQEAREKSERERNRERIRERERERLRERNRRDRERDRQRDRSRNRDRRERERDRYRNDHDRNNYDDDNSDDEIEEKELHPGNISSREELETYLNKSSMSISKSMSMVGNPKFVSMFEIEENASDASGDEEDDFTMNHFTIKCKICKKDIPIEEVENHKCESMNIPLIKCETEEHKKEMEEKARKEKEEKVRLEREKKEKEEKERLEKEEEKRIEREKRQRRQKEREKARERERRRDERSRDRGGDRRRDERSRDRGGDRRRDERSRDRKRRDNKESEWEQRYNTKEEHKHERDRSRRRREENNEIREGSRYEIIKEYEQVLNDEVTVKHGHVFEVEKVFEDGWCVGTNLSTNKWGAIPMNCLNNRQERRRRIQSLYMA